MNLGRSRQEAWIYLVIGIVLFIAGLASVFSTESKTIYLGALVIGPIMALRAYVVLRDEPVSYHKEVSLEVVPQGKHAVIAKMGGDPIFLTCEGCGKEYINMEAAKGDPDLRTITPESDIGLLQDASREARTWRAGFLVAPCPGCGHVQRSMLPMAVARLSDFWWAMAFFSLLAAGLLYVRAINVDVQMEPEGTREKWYIAAAVAVGAAVLMGIWHKLRRRLHNPNRARLDARLKEAKETSMSKEEYLAYRGEPGAVNDGSRP
ncbi:MAG: hypothetical protein K8T89_15705 [Planctomycetes bacterium]|nr:hypothetical protein [Planctomycetota bacterium]